MDEPSLYVVWDGSDGDRPFADDLASRLVQLIQQSMKRAKLTAQDTPKIENIAGFEKLPLPDKMEPLSVLVLVLPNRDFTAGERQRIEAFYAACGSDQVRLVPVSSEAARDKPKAPLDGIVSFPVHDDANKDAQVERLTRLLLNQLCLRVSSERRSVFISYRQNDGKFAARELEKRLVQRGYRVWRDDSPDRDDFPLIGPGTPAQESIRRAIVEQGFVLVIDSPDAPNSWWVEQEVSMGLANILPVLPVVIDDPSTGAPPKGNSRFPALEKQGRFVQCSHAVLTESTTASAIDEPFLERLEQQMSEYLLAHFRTSRRLVAQVKARLVNGFAFEWEGVVGKPLLYQTTISRESQATPHLHLRFLVQCAPYDRVFEETIQNLLQDLRDHGRHCQYGLVVHQATIYRPEKARLLSQCGGHIMVLEPDQLSLLPAVLKLEEIVA